MDEESLEDAICQRWTIDDDSVPLGIVLWRMPLTIWCFASYDCGDCVRLESRGQAWDAHIEGGLVGLRV